jgi:hypothetical protein
LQPRGFRGDIDAIGNLADFEVDVDAQRNVGIEQVPRFGVLFEALASTVTE